MGCQAAQIILAMGGGGRGRGTLPEIKSFTGKFERIFLVAFPPKLKLFVSTNSAEKL